MSKLSAVAAIRMLLAGADARAQTFRPVGPLGDDVHSLAAGPLHPGEILIQRAWVSSVVYRNDFEMLCACARQVMLDVFPRWD